MDTCSRLPSLRTRSVSAAVCSPGSRAALPWRPRRSCGTISSSSVRPCDSSRAVTEHRRELPVHAGDPLLPVDHDDRLRCAFEQLVEQRGLHQKPLLGALAAAQLAQHQPHQQRHAEAQQGGAHRAVHRLNVPGREHRRLLHARADRQAKPRHRLHSVDPVVPVGRAWKHRHRGATRRQQPLQQRHLRRHLLGSALRGKMCDRAAADAKQGDRAARPEVDTGIQALEIVEAQVGNRHTQHLAVLALDAASHSDRAGALACPLR